MENRTTKFMSFEHLDLSDRWVIKNKKSGAVLAWVEWYNPWRQYVLAYVQPNTVFNSWQAFPGWTS